MPSAEPSGRVHAHAEEDESRSGHVGVDVEISRFDSHRLTRPTAFQPPQPNSNSADTRRTRLACWTSGLVDNGAGVVHVWIPSVQSTSHYTSTLTLTLTLTLTPLPPPIPPLLPSQPTPHSHTWLV